ncbi:MAG TPA: DUF2189 domain-containing protein [Azoarcus taiwanensis]|uniref:DUF2189 domain-containing protein n=1 Tax=Azoarcus taiwanensis TaxID=666964 RepID=A0A972FHZ0_9RHOO|nr:DUF2189 domain-containing protein [Azoarcus taiwanensis]NMG02641.1 DUF2189 domain-containing protein [Azoarcus taiwanensis]HRQ55967.1 DUF2189 domain-containing protein [Azoarcus taiwanensis]
MTQQSENNNPEDPGLPFPKARDARLGAPFRWLARGLSDFKSCPIPSLFYGFCFAGMGLLVTMVFEHAYEYTMAVTSGFLLLGPFLAMGLYEISRRRELGENCSLAPTLTVWRRNAGNIGIFAVVLGVVFLVWARASLVIFALFYSNEVPNLSGFLSQVVRLENLDFLAVYFGVGFVFASIAFGVSIVSIPLMLDRNQDAISSMLGSIGVLFRNPGTMLLWAVLLVSLTIIGFLTFHLGLVLLMPIIGHATWHAYRELLEPLP